MPLRYLSDNCRYSWYLPPSWCPVCPVISKWYINAAANYNNLLVETKKENCHTMWKLRIHIDIHEICGKQTKVMISFISMDTTSCTLALKLETANIKPVPEISWFFRDAPPRQLRPKPGQGEGGGVKTSKTWICQLLSFLPKKYQTRNIFQLIFIRIDGNL